MSQGETMFFVDGGGWDGTGRTCLWRPIGTWPRAFADKYDSGSNRRLRGLDPVRTTSIHAEFESRKIVSSSVPVTS